YRQTRPQLLAFVTKLTTTRRAQRCPVVDSDPLAVITPKPWCEAAWSVAASARAQSHRGAVESAVAIGLRQHLTHSVDRESVAGYSSRLASLPLVRYALLELVVVLRPGY